MTKIAHARRLAGFKLLQRLPAVPWVRKRHHSTLGEPPDGIEFGFGGREDFDTMIEWATRAGRHPGLSDAECYYAAYPRGRIWDG